MTRPGKNLQPRLAWASSKISVHRCLIWVPLEVLALDEVLNALLDQLGHGLEEGELREHLRHELLVAQLFPHLHDANDGSLDRNRPILLDSLLVVSLL